MLVQILSLDINWNVLKPEEREEKLRELGDLVSRGYHLYTPEQKKAVSLQNVYTVSYQNTPAWDDILSKNDELQAGDWRNMSLEEKKAAHFLAWGPVAEANTEFRQAVGIRVALILAGVFGAYMALRAFFRSRKELPTLEPEWVEASRERMIHERMNPYTGESAHLFTKDGIKEQ